jgi:hypothetical protein
MPVNYDKLRLIISLLGLSLLFVAACSTPIDLPQTTIDPTTVAAAKVVLSDNLTPN